MDTVARSPPAAIRSRLSELILDLGVWSCARSEKPYFISSSVFSFGNEDDALVCRSHRRPLAINRAATQYFSEEKRMDLLHIGQRSLQTQNPDEALQYTR
jgi:hypothetical protein